MSNTKYSTKPIQPGSNGSVGIPAEISCVFRFGKDDHFDPFMKHEDIDELDTDEKSKQTVDMTLTTAAYNAAIMNIKNQLKLSSSLQVHSSDGSSISVFNTEPVISASSTYTNLEPSIDLSLGDTSFLQPYLDDPSLPLPFDDPEFENSLFQDFSEDPSSFDSLFGSNMTIQELQDVPMEQSEQYPSHELSLAYDPLSTNDDTTISSISSHQSEDTERDDTNRRRTKKSDDSARKLARFGNKQVIKYSQEYQDRRIKNNEAVKKSRMKAKAKQECNESQMTKLTNENRVLNDRVDLLMKELQVLRSLYKELKQDHPSESTQTVARVNTH